MAEAEIEEQYARAVDAILRARHFSAFTGAGISVESGIPPFRGRGGLWDRYDPRILEIDYFQRHPDIAWPVIREIFYDHFAAAQPNDAHLTLARLEAAGRLETLITQNIDDLHARAGSRRVIEFHGSSRMLACPQCGRRVEAASVDMRMLPPRCTCGAVLKPDFVFFGEGIPAGALQAAQRCAGTTDVMLLIGTTGEVYPAASLPRSAAARGALIIEINPEPSLYTPEITDIFIAESAVRAMRAVATGLGAAGVSGLA